MGLAVISTPWWPRRLPAPRPDDQSQHVRAGAAGRLRGPRGGQPLPRVRVSAALGLSTQPCRLVELGSALGPARLTEDEGVQNCRTITALSGQMPFTAGILWLRGWPQPVGVALSWQTRETGLGRHGAGAGGGEAFPRPRLLGEPF